MFIIPQIGSLEAKIVFLQIKIMTILAEYYLIYLRMKYFFAVDLGATSGRTLLSSFDGNKVDMRELTRFRNPIIPMGGHLYWDLPMLYHEVLLGLRKAAEEGVELTSIGIDTWGCDFAFFGKDGQLLGLPHCYRDPHTEGAQQKFFERMPAEEIYSRTGIQFMCTLVTDIKIDICIISSWIYSSSLTTSVTTTRPSQGENSSSSS